jgi:hypothetical protein
MIFLERNRTANGLVNCNARMIQWGNYKQGIFQPYLMACQLPKSHWGRVPASVSIVEEPCQTATNNLRVIYNKHEGPKEKFAVCVKGLDFPDDDLSVRLGTRHNAGEK